MAGKMKIWENHDMVVWEEGQNIIVGLKGTHVSLQVSKSTYTEGLLVVTGCTMIVRGNVGIPSVQVTI